MLQITADVIPDGLFDLMAYLMDELNEDGHCKEGKHLNDVLNDQSYAFLVLIITVYDYAERIGSLPDVLGALHEYCTIVERNLCEPAISQ